MLNPKLVPDLVDVVIGKFIYELQFRVEKEGTGEEPLPIDTDAPFDEDDSGAKDNGNEEHMEEDGMQMDLAPKQLPPNVPPTVGATGGSSGAAQGKAMEASVTTPTPKEKATSVRAVPR